MPFYAVAAGRTCGIFTTWDNGAKEQVTGYSAAVFKKFNTEAEAERYLNQHDSPRKRPRPVDFGADETSTVPLSTRRRTDAAPVVHAVITPPRPHYVVSKGHATGVFSTWGDVEAAILNHPHPQFRKFPTQAEADAYWARNRPAPVGSILKAIPGVHAPPRVQPARPAPANNGANPTKFYALAKGRKGISGIFTSWVEVEPHVTNFFGATYKSFWSLEEAETFMAAHAAAALGAVGDSASDPDPLDPLTLVAFCDGSAIGNGKASCRAAFACVFPHNESWNVAEKLPTAQAAATNNRAEYLAALEALKRANIQDPSQSQPLYIFSDSMLLIRSMTEWLPTWIKNNWRKADGEAVKNVDLLQQVTQTRGRRRVLWRHVKAHTNKRDWKSIWNDKVDQLARSTALS